MTQKLGKPQIVEQRDAAVQRSQTGGPKTSAGKAVSRANAAKHGLTAKALLEELLGDELVERHRDLLLDHYQPRNPVERLLVTEMARHSAALEKIEKFEPAVLRTGARQVPQLFANGPLENLDEAAYLDRILSAAATSEGVRKITRYRRPHERGFYAAMSRLEESRKQITAASPSPVAKPELAESIPRSEAECEAYLIERLRREGFKCPACGDATGRWLATRRRWQCRKCRRQIGPRVGTLMEKSRLPLNCWFSAIEEVLNNPGITIAELSTATRITRRATLSRMIQKIRSALVSEDRTRLLAGLDRAVERSQEVQSQDP